MKTEMTKRFALQSVASLVMPFGPRIAFAPDDEGASAAAAAAAAEQAAAEKATGDAAAEKAAADAAAAEKAESDRRAAEEAAAEAARQEAEKNMSVKERALLHEVMEKKNKIKSAEGRIAELEAMVKRFEGVDLDRVQDLLKAEKEREERELEARGEYDRLKERIAQERAAERKAFEERIQALEVDLASRNSTIDDLTIGQTFSASTFINEDLVLTPTKARILYGAYFDKVDGKIVGFDKPRGAKDRTMHVDASGEPMSFDAAMKKIIEADPERDSIVKAKMKPGAASRSQETTPGSKSQQENESRKGQLFGASRIAAGLVKK